MPRYSLEVSAVGENGETVETTVEKEGASKAAVLDEYQSQVEDIVEYWDVTVERCTEVTES